jgi:predicted metal-dependent phosphoesterase TrpH
LIDLHTHTDESDGTYTPAELVAAAVSLKLEALGITDHDTLAGYDAAEPLAREAGLDLVCGIELSTKLRGRSVHLLGYFLDAPPKQAFRDWLHEMQRSRRDRNIRLAAKLRSMGFDISLEEVEARGKSLAGRPHFAQVMVEKGYVENTRQAFDDYLDESAKAYVDRQEPQFGEAVRRILDGGGLPSLPHPVRVPKNGEAFEDMIGDMVNAGLRGLEVYHSDHDRDDERFFTQQAERHNLAITGGSDFHGALKPHIHLGTGAGNLNVPKAVLDKLRNDKLRRQRVLGPPDVSQPDHLSRGR